ncbi:hypothetical protein LJC60_08310, partial [Ruminococcaceae bacterium OttesenSCG-928-D13]|nr:hypothetical protein [Ruminococcaceae bacterium OttesenSCG-928-D13]
MLEGVADGVDWAADYPDGSDGCTATISAVGLLTVPPSEADKTLRVTATAEADPRLKAQVVFTVESTETVPDDAVLGVKILTPAAYLELGDTLELKALAEVHGDRSTAVTWELLPAPGEETVPVGVSLTA